MSRAFSTADTIVAIATPPGRGGIGVVRLSGADAPRIAAALVSAQELRPRVATLARVRETANSDRSAIDQAVVTFFPGPASYTGDDLVEISAHGSPVILNALVAGAVASGARLAQPGEFTLRAYLNGRIDLMQAEAVKDLVDAVTPLQARAAFDQLHGTLTGVIAEIDAALFDLIARLEASVDFPEEGYHFADRASVGEALVAISARLDALLATGRQGRMIREGMQIAIVGRPNVGKSSLFNALAGAARAIVTDIPGTTRDLISEVVDLEGLRVTLVDTAGIRESSDAIEIEGVARAQGVAAVSDLLLVVVDRSAPLDRSDLAPCVHANAVIVASKADLPAAWDLPDAVAISALTGLGIAELKRRILSALDIEPTRDLPSMTNLRHLTLVAQAGACLERAREALADERPMPEEFVLADLQEARACFDEITGRRTPDDVLAHIFEQFCIGK
ncbi:MAG TPA: tRNA uridine-5-carboxymethylaminomethyl(34) synthesis GTPase MnmE [Vicinamibacterales bacterium]|nr:tRNA uridine-5-carboxymethylaminomethyl(34) synthesis GTPase MnmE [Vicinamibacterales bacterium]